MLKRKLTISLPESPDALQHILKVLLQYGLISEKKAHTIQECGFDGELPKMTRWALAAKRLKSEGFLEGQGEEVKKLTRDFRENFNL